MNKLIQLTLLSSRKSARSSMVVIIHFNTIVLKYCSKSYPMHSSGETSVGKISTLQIFNALKRTFHISVVQRTKQLSIIQSEN